MDNLLSKPHQADECTQCASDNKTALEAVCKQVLSARRRDDVFYTNFTNYFTTVSRTKEKRR